MRTKTSLKPTYVFCGVMGSKLRLGPGQIVPHTAHDWPAEEGDPSEWGNGDRRCLGVETALDSLRYALTRVTGPDWAMRMLKVAIEEGM